MHILHNYEKYLKIIRGKVQRLLKKFLLNVDNAINAISTIINAISFKVCGHF